jgi:hypothetical protein
MKKLTVSLAAFALATMATGAASAASLNPNAVSHFSPFYPAATAAQCSSAGDSARLWSKTFLADKLAVKGIKFNAISRADNCFKVAAVSKSGKVTPELYDPSTLLRVS